jgi:tetratricopeptide (TPR) repeat protein
MSEWKLQDFEIRYFIALSSQRLNRTTEIDQGFLVSPYSVSPESLAIWNAWKQIAAMFADKGVDMALLRNQVDLFPQESRLHEFLGQALLHYGDQKGASEAFAVAAELASDPASVARVLNRILDLDSPFTKTVGATHLRERLLGLKLSNHSDKSAFVDAMKAIALAHKLEEVALALSEVHVSLNPEDVASRFDLAWKYLNGSQFGLSMTHYEAIPSSDRSGTIWNNLGVNYARLQMNGKAVSAYQMAAEKAESIAQGNIAQKLVGAGFLDEAQTRAEAAVSVEGHHESIIEVLASIKSSRELEDKTHKAKQEEARSEQDIRLAIGRAALSSGGPNPIGIWSTADGLIEIMENLDGTYTGTGEAIRETHGRALGLFRGQKMIEKHRVVVSLTRFGNALEGSLVWEASERPVNLLGTINSTRKLLLMISDDGSSIEGFEISYDMKQVQWKRPLAITADAGHQLTEA